MSSDVIALLGRETDIEVIRQFLAGAAEDGHALLITGPAGIGKTAVLDAAVTMARAAGAWVARAEGVDDEAGIPFAGLSRLLAPLDGVMERLDPGHRAVLLAVLDQDAGDGALVERAAAVASLVTALQTAAGARPVVVAVDGLPTMDTASAECLRSLAGGGRRIGVLARPGRPRSAAASRNTD